MVAGETDEKEAPYPRSQIHPNQSKSQNSLQMFLLALKQRCKHMWLTQRSPLLTVCLYYKYCN